MLRPPEGCWWSHWTLIVGVVWIWFQELCQGALYNPENDDSCHAIGGICSYTYHGCDSKIAGDGKFHRGLCAGPDYRQCCVLPVVPTVAVHVDPWRMCYTCEHTLSNGKETGNKACQDPLPEEPDLDQINCTTYCKKEMIYLDATSHAIKRSCGPYCYGNATYPEHVVSSCCYGYLCNGAQSTPSRFTLAEYLKVCVLSCITYFLTAFYIRL